MRYFYGIVFILFSLLGCSEPQQSDFVGKWHGDGIELELKSDSTLTAIGDKAYLLLFEARPSLANKTLKGKWSFGDRYIYDGKNLKIDTYFLLKLLLLVKNRYLFYCTGELIRCRTMINEVLKKTTTYIVLRAM